LLFVGNKTLRNPWKDYQALRKTLNLLKPDKKIWLLCLGEKGKNETIGNIEIKFKGYEQNSFHLANYYRAADIYVYPSKVDTFPNTILEALSCGTPVIATAVGGIPEQIKGLNSENPIQAYMDPKFNTYSCNEATGILIPPGDPEAMAFWIDRLLKDKIGLSCMSKNAALDAKKRFDMKKQAETYIEWYKDLIGAFSKEEIC
jgi:glycosyltransferase involved in cell wall biosynthesis